MRLALVAAVLCGFGGVADAGSRTPACSDHPFPAIEFRPSFAYASRMIMAATSSKLVTRLIERGVRIADPASVTIDPAIATERIAPGVVIHPGCRLRGARTVIGPGCELGREGPLTLEDCCLQADVGLGGGFAAGAVFLAGVSIAGNAHVRPGSLLEEDVTAGHAVGLKQTVLMPSVTLGSLVNLCDCLMGGGTGRERHSEVGSSFVHFNFTPNGDKATPSLIGDVPRGVMLDRPPIFLGGQGGIVGPARIAYGTVLAAGTVLREDVEPEGQLIFGRPREGVREHVPGVYRNARRIVHNNLIYIGNLHALRAWYHHVRVRWMTGSAIDTACHAGALENINAMLHERIARLAVLCANLRDAPDAPGLAADEGAFQHAVAERWPAWEAALAPDALEAAGAETRGRFLAALPRGEGRYRETIQALPPANRAAGTAWLQELVDTVLRRTLLTLTT